MHRPLLTLVLCLTAVVGRADVPLWLRDVRISPDGQQIAFCYKGDIYTVAATGGSAVRLTTQDSYECYPVWSPDGRQIAFASDRHGNFDIFVMPASGGPARRLTVNSAAETPWTFTPDGKNILFSATIQDPAESALFPYAVLTEVYSVPVAGGRTTQLLGTPAEYICYDAQGTSFLYQDRKGSEDEWRKHHTSSVTRDIWRYDVATGHHTNLTQRAGEDRNPVWAADGQTFYFLSERDGDTFNVYATTADDPATVSRLTSFKTHPVRFLSVGKGDLLCYTYDGEIYTQQGAEGKPVKVKIDLVRDDEDQVIEVRGEEANGAAVSADGKQIAFVVRGEVFVTSVDYATTKQITHTAARESEVCFAPDNRTLAYTSERDGLMQLYLARIDREEDPNFANATTISEEHLLPSKSVERCAPAFSPDGHELAFIEGRNKLMVYNLETKKTRQVTDGSTWYSTDGSFTYRWSPDSKWFTLSYIANGHDPYADIGLVSAQGGDITNLTNSGYSDGGPQFVMEGNAILFTSERYGMRAHASWGSQRDAMLVFLNQDAYDRFNLSKEDYELLKEVEKQQKGEKPDGPKEDDKDEDKDKPGGHGGKDKKDKEVKDIVVEIDGIEDRIVRLTPNSSNLGGAYVTDNGETLYCLISAGMERGMELRKLDLRKKDSKLIKTIEGGRADLRPDAEGKNLFLLGGRNMQKLEIGKDALTPIRFEAKFKLNLTEERAYMFQHVYQQERQRFYDIRMHGVDWEGLTRDYRKFLPHINNNYDFAELLSEWLGELNVSHTGGRYRPVKSMEATASLGLLYDWTYTGQGLRVAEVLEKGPFDRANTKIGVGTIVTQIDGVDITPEDDYTTLLADRAGHKTLVTLRNASSGDTWQEVVIPISSTRHTDLLYDRWVRSRAADVERWSGGRLGYVHIKSMGDESYRTVYSDILGKYNDREGIIIDIRFNGGGRLHEDVEVLFSGKKYLTQVIRGREACDMPSRRWNKPSIMLTCEACYSNAHGTPWVYRERGIGRIVGMPVPGTMTSVSWERLQDPELIFGIPVTGYRKADGSYLENTQLEPDVTVANSPETVVKGEDTQLRRAVDELLKEIDGK